MNDTLFETKHDETLAAYREAGHATLAWLEGIKIRNVWLDGDEPAGLVIKVPSMVDPKGKGRAAIMAMIRVMLAGPTAVETYRFGFSNGSTAENFFDQYAQIDKQTFCKAAILASRIAEDGTAFTLDVRPHVELILTTRRIWSAVKAVAEALLANRELAGSEVQDLVQTAMANFERHFDERDSPL